MNPDFYSDIKSAHRRLFHILAFFLFSVNYKKGFKNSWNENIFRFNLKFYKLKVYILLRQVLNLFFKGGNQLGVRSPQFSSPENPPSLGTTKGLAPFGIPIHSYISIF